jgi:hypothetical protein
MRVIIINIKMILCQNLEIFIIDIKIKVRLVCNMNQNTNLVGILMHDLHFILHLETIILSKIHYINNGIF